VSVLVDTNVLLRRAQPDHISHTAAIDSVARLVASGEPAHVTAQNIAEFWNVATRPAIYTFDGADFKRYDVEVLHPAVLV
jgi:predicted nucleic acid-binding protein